MFLYIGFQRNIVVLGVFQLRIGGVKEKSALLKRGCVTNKEHIAQLLMKVLIGVKTP
jgi:hypothetical protein